MDIKVAFTSRDIVPDVKRALASIKQLADRLYIAYRKADIEPRNIVLSHGFYPVDGLHLTSTTMDNVAGTSPKDVIENLSATERERFGFRKVRERWYRTMNSPLEQSPYYQLRVEMLVDGVEEQACRLEAKGFTLAFHPLMYTFDLRFVTLHFKDMVCGPFVGQVFYADTDTPLPSSGTEERTGLFGPLVHIQLVEFLAALKREAIPSLYIRDPSGYLESGNVSELVTACKQAGMTLTHFWETLSTHENTAPGEEAFFKGSLDLPEPSHLPDLEGAVGSEERLRQLEQFLVTHGHLLPDIDKLLADGR